MLDIVDKALDEAHGALQILRADSAMLAMISMAGGDLGHALKAGKRVFSCGNGGSMSDAMHFAEELSGRFRGDRRALPATAISDVLELCRLQSGRELIEVVPHHWPVPNTTRSTISIKMWMTLMCSSWARSA